MSAQLIWITPDAERMIAHIARVSNPANQNNPEYAKLLRYCMEHGHWSVFEMARAFIEVVFDALPVAGYLNPDGGFAQEEWEAGADCVEIFRRPE